MVPDQKSVTRMQHTFMGQWDLSEGDAAPHIAAALQHPERYVLKPNREGGGNNFYGQAMVRKINEVQGTTRAQEYILMAAIQPVPQENYLIRAGMPAERVQTVGEVGVFGVVLARHGDIVLNRSAGEVLIRSKAMGVHEGGVSTGHSCISSVIAVWIFFLPVLVGGGGGEGRVLSVDTSVAGFTVNTLKSIRMKFFLSYQNVSV